MKIHQTPIVNNRCYKYPTLLNVRGLMLHSVGCPQPKAEVFVKQFNSPEKKGVAVHGFIDFNTGEIYQTLGWTTRAGHCGGACNNTCIAIELCEPTAKGGDFSKAYNSAVELFAYLCKKFKLNPMTDITSHYEAHKKGLASNHADPKPLFDKYGKSMDGFRSDVAKMLQSS